MVSMPKLDRATLLRFAGYPAFFFAALIIFGYVTFPFDRLALNVIDQLERSLDVDVEMEGFSPSWGTGVTIDKLSVTMPSRSKTDPPQTYVVTNVHARAGLFALLGRRLSVSVSADVAGGEVEAHYSESTSGIELQLEASGVRLEEFAALVALTGVPVKGSAMAHLDLELPEKKVKNAKGRLELTIVDGQVGEKGARIKAGLTGSLAYMAAEGIEMEKGLALGRFAANFDIKDGRATAEEFDASGGDAEGNFAGFILLRDHLGASALTGYVKFKVSDDYLRDSRKFSMLMGSPSLTRATRADGFYGFNVRGTLSNPQFLPAKTEGAAMAGAGSAATRKPGMGPRPGMGAKPGVSIAPGDLGEADIGMGAGAKAVPGATGAGEFPGRDPSAPGKFGAVGADGTPAEGYRPGAGAPGLVRPGLEPGVASDDPYTKLVPVPPSPGTAAAVTPDDDDTAAPAAAPDGGTE